MRRRVLILLLTALSTMLATVGWPGASHAMVDRASSGLTFSVSPDSAVVADVVQLTVQSTDPCPAGTDHAEILFTDGHTFSQDIPVAADGSWSSSFAFQIPSLSTVTTGNHPWTAFCVTAQG